MLYRTDALVRCFVVEGPRGDRSRRTATGELSLDDDGILTVCFIEGARVDVAEIDDVLSLQVELIRESGGLVAVLADVTPIRSMTRAAMQRTATHPVSEMTAAVALVVDSPVSRVLGNFYLELTVQPYPARLFRAPEEARGWLRAELDKRRS